MPFKSRKMIAFCGQFAMFVGVFAGVSAFLSSAKNVQAEEPAKTLTADEVKFFETKIRPVLIKECYGCHSNKTGNARGGLRLDTQALTHIGGGSGPAIVPGDVGESLLFNAMTYEDWAMPPNRRLPQNIIDDFREWIEMGAPDPRITEVAEIKSSISDEDIELAKDNFWAYQSPELPDVPAAGSDWAEGTIDQFVYQKLTDGDLSPAEDAPPLDVLRRLCFDIVGLPPTQKQIEYFERYWRADPQRTVEFVVDQLLELDQYGERWGRHWLDVARYAESTGREVNMTFPHAWRYRDYVIDSFNADKPFDQFIQEQIAGDLLPVDSDEEWAKNLVATTFLAVGPKNVNEDNRVQFAADVRDEQIDAVTRVFLGQSVACARCHDHKFDAIPQADYYALAGVFSNMETYFGNPPSEYGRMRIAQRKQDSSLIRLPIDDPSPYDPSYTAAELRELQDQMAALQQQSRDLRSNRDRSNMTASSIRERLALANRMSELSDKIAVVDENGQPMSYCMGVQEKGTPSDLPILVRGEIDQPADRISRGFPQVLCSSQPELSAAESGRLKLARWIGSDENTLAARVMVNRIWIYLMGQGIVSSPENFGVTGAAPSHPELLDYLAVRFVESGWSTKALIREIATSRAYRMATTFHQEYHEADPDNKFLWRANPRRLDAEALRDSMLFVSGSIALDRPRGSTVAEAGYGRVRDGFIGDPREVLMSAIRDEAKGMMGGGMGAYRNRGRGEQGSRRGRLGQGMQGGQRPGMQGRGMQGMRGQLGAGMPDGKDRDQFREAITAKVEKQLDQEDAVFRSVYLPTVRNEIPRSLEVFDFGDSSVINGKREESHTPDQALYMLNNNFVRLQSEAFAKRLQSEYRSLPDQVDAAFRLAFGRPATSREKDAAGRLLRSFSGDARQEGLVALCQGLFASAEFRFIN